MTAGIGDIDMEHRDAEFLKHDEYWIVSWVGGIDFRLGDRRGKYTLTTCPHVLPHPYHFDHSFVHHVAIVRRIMIGWGS